MNENEQTFTRTKNSKPILNIILSLIVITGVSFYVYTIFEKKENDTSPKKETKTTTNVKYEKKDSFNSKDDVCKNRGYFVKETEQDEYKYELVVCMGEQSTGGYSLEINSVDIPNKDEITVTVKEKYPSFDGAVTDALTYPATSILLNEKPSNIKVINLNSYEYKNLSDNVLIVKDELLSLFNKINIYKKTCSDTALLLVPIEDHKIIKYEDLTDDLKVSLLNAMIDKDDYTIKGNDTYVANKVYREKYMDLFGIDDIPTSFISKEALDDDLKLISDDHGALCGRSAIEYEAIPLIGYKQNDKIVIDVAEIKHDLTKEKNTMEESIYYRFTFTMDEETGNYYWESTKIYS